MLTSYELKTVIWMLKCGNSYEEIAQTILDTRNHTAFLVMCLEIEEYTKEQE